MITILAEPIKAPYPLADDTGVGNLCMLPESFRPHDRTSWFSSMHHATGNKPASLNGAGPKMPARPDAVRIEMPLLPREVRIMNQILSEAPVDLTQLGRLAGGCSRLIERTLSLCHSSLFGMPQTISGLEHAVIIAGAETVRTLMLANALMDYARSQLCQEDFQVYWWHSMVVAQFSKRIAEWLGESQPEQAYLAGILHDAGAVPLLAAVTAEATKGTRALHTIGDAPGPQRFRYGVDHTETGRRLGTAWNFPYVLIETFSLHHMPCEHFSAHPLVRIVAVAEQIARLYGASWEANNAEHEPDTQDRALRFLLDYIPTLTPKASIQLNAALQADLEATQRKLEHSLGPLPAPIMP